MRKSILYLDKLLEDQIKINKENYAKLEKLLNRESENVTR
jgi:hypothetical protein